VEKKFEPVEYPMDGDIYPIMKIHTDKIFTSLFWNH